MNTSGRLTAAEKARKAIDLRCQGVGWDDVARQCGYANAPNACRVVRTALAKLPEQSVDELRAIENMKLDRLEREAWKEWFAVHWATCSRGLVTDSEDMPVTDVAHRERWASILLRAYERRARLHGLDRLPREQQEAEEVDAAVEDELSAWLAEVESQVRREIVPGQPSRP